MRAFYFIECDVDGRGQRWRLADVHETWNGDGSYFMATMVDDGDMFQEDMRVYRENECRIIGPFSTLDLLRCVQVAEFVRGCKNGFLPQKKPGERPIQAGTANGLLSAAHSISGCKWQRENF